MTLTAPFDFSEITIDRYTVVPVDDYARHGNYAAIIDTTTDRPIDRCVYQLPYAHDLADRMNAAARRNA